MGAGGRGELCVGVGGGEGGQGNVLKLGWNSYQNESAQRVHPGE